MHMRRHLGGITLFALFAFAAPVAAQGQRPMNPSAEAERGQSESAKPAASAAPADQEQSSVTEHTIRVGGADDSLQGDGRHDALKNDKGEPIGLMYSVAYTR